MTVGEDLAAILGARYGAAGASEPLDPPVRNALRVTVRSQFRVSILLPTASTPLII